MLYFVSVLLFCVNVFLFQLIYVFAGNIFILSLICLSVVFQSFSNFIISCCLLKILPHLICALAVNNLQTCRFSCMEFSLGKHLSWSCATHMVGNERRHLVVTSWLLRALVSRLNNVPVFAGRCSLSSLSLSINIPLYPLGLPRSRQFCFSYVKFFHSS